MVMIPVETVCGFLLALFIASPAICFAISVCDHFKRKKDPESQPIDFTKFAVEVSYDVATGRTQWTNQLGHPLDNYYQQVGPFLVMANANDGPTSLDTWTTEGYIRLSKAPGESHRRNFKRAAKRIHRWNEGLLKEGSKQQRLITKLLEDNKELWKTVKKESKYQGVFITGGSEDEVIEDDE